MYFQSFKKFGEDNAFHNVCQISIAKGVIDNLIKIIPNHCTLFENINENDINNLSNNKKIKYFHFSLESENKNTQYGIYSNNILSETMSIEYINKSNLYKK